MRYLTQYPYGLGVKIEGFLPCELWLPTLPPPLPPLRSGFLDPPQSAKSKDSDQGGSRKPGVGGGWVTRKEREEEIKEEEKSVCWLVWGWSYYAGSIRDQSQTNQQTPTTGPPPMPAARPLHARSRVRR